MKDSRLMFTEGELPPEEENSAVDAVDAGTRITELSVWKTREDIQHRQKQAEKHKAESNPESKQNQRRVMKKRYSRRHGEEAERTAERTAEAAEKAARAAEEAAEKAAEGVLHSVALALREQAVGLHEQVHPVARAVYLRLIEKKRVQQVAQLIG